MFWKQKPEARGWDVKITWVYVRAVKVTEMLSVVLGFGSLHWQWISLMQVVSTGEVIGIYIFQLYYNNIILNI